MKRLLILFVAALPAGAIADPAAGKVDFNYDIRPIISQKCYHCHGPDEGSREANLRLDIREEALRDRDGIRAIVPGDLEASDLVVRVLSTDKDEMMPPPKHGEALTAREKELLRRWVAQGAEYKEHWAWAKPVRPAVPVAGGNASTLRHPIDAFISERLEKVGLTPSPEADPHTLIRRLSLDLIGLPPAPDEVAAFVGDASVDFYEKAVDRLLASPHFGEKWARMWLDLARFADSTGYGSDKFRLNVWPYRDWVINAFNRNVPYDQFTIEQLAGDLLPNATTEQIAATAFHRNTMTNIEGGTIDEEYRVAAVKDRIATTSQVWMGLTMQCAQCHTHKFDPISHRDYYSFYAIFNQTEDSDREDEEPKMALPTPEEKSRMQQLAAEIAELERKLKVTTPELEAERHEWEAQMNEPIEWTTLDPVEMTSTAGAKLTRREDGSIVVEGGAPGRDTYTIAARTALRGITAFRLEALTDPALPGGGPGRGANGNAVLSELRIATAPGEPRTVRGRFVRVEALGKGRMLSLAEVEVLNGAENLARKGRATQSSTDFDGPPELAIDGTTDGDFAGAKSVTHTRESDGPWWEVDLGGESTIDRVVVWNRTDGGLGSRLENSRVLVLDAARKPVAELPIEAAPSPSAELIPGKSPRAVALRNASADFEQSGFGAEKAIDGQGKGGWAFGGATGENHAAIFEARETIGAAEEGASVLTFRIEQGHGDNHTLGRFRLSATTKKPPVRELPPAIRAILAIEPSERAPEDRERLDAYFRPLSRTLAGPRQELVTKRKELAAFRPVALPVMRELGAGRRRETRLLNKGNYLAPGDVMQPALPASFAPGIRGDGAPDRLAAARWLVHSDNPLTARVTVNRFWSQLFGTGLVETEEDFGTQGALPSHPELLDWLAITFQTSRDSTPPGLGWDVKALLKTIVMSATYRQSSRVTPDHLAKDARNRLLARYPRRRLEAETVRDQALALSGLLSRKLGGASVYPPQPEGLWKVAFNGGQNKYPTSEGEDRYRRGLYTFVRRTMPNPSMATFDAPSRENCTLRRVPTNTPLQAFVTLNDPAFVECAQVLARRIVREGGADTASRLRWALELTLARPAQEKQLTALQQLHDSEVAHFKTDSTAAAKLAASETQPLPKDADPVELAAWTVVANVLLNLDGVLTKG